MNFHERREIPRFSPLASAISSTSSRGGAGQDAGEDSLRAGSSRPDPTLRSPPVVRFAQAQSLLCLLFRLASRRDELHLSRRRPKTCSRQASGQAASQPASQPGQAPATGLAAAQGPKVLEDGSQEFLNFKLVVKVNDGLNQSINQSRAPWRIASALLT